MSPSTQRPSFVLIWIGIILLTFSFISDFLADARSETLATATPGNLVLPGLLLEDGPSLPGLPADQDLGLRAYEPLDLSEAGLRGQKLPPSADTLLADLESHPDSSTPEAVEFPVETEDGQVASSPLERAPSTSGAVAIPSSTSSSSQERPALHSPVRSTLSEDPAPTTQGSRTSGNEREYRIQRSDLGRLKATLVDSPNPGRTIIRLRLENPDRVEEVLDRLAPNRDRRQLLAKAKEILEDLEEVQEQDEEQRSGLEVDGGSDSQDAKLRRWNRSQLVVKLQRTPRGLELLAEMSVEQMDQFLKRLNARSR